MEKYQEEKYDDNLFLTDIIIILINFALIDITILKSSLIFIFLSFVFLMFFAIFNLRNKRINVVRWNLKGTYSFFRVIIIFLLSEFLTYYISKLKNHCLIFILTIYVFIVLIFCLISIISIARQLSAIYFEDYRKISENKSLYSLFSTYNGLYLRIVKVINILNKHIKVKEFENSQNTDDNLEYFDKISQELSKLDISELKRLKVYLSDDGITIKSGSLWKLVLTIFILIFSMFISHSVSLQFYYISLPIIQIPRDEIINIIFMVSVTLFIAFPFIKGFYKERKIINKRFLLKALINETINLRS